MGKFTIDKKAIAIVLTAFVLLGLTASVINPLHEATDELRHYRFVRYLSTNRSLPVQGEQGCSMQGHHPPLYYLIAATATAWIDTGRDVCYSPPANDFWGYRYWEVGSDNKNQYLHGTDETFPWYGEALVAHIARAINVLIGAGVVLITWLIGRAIWPGKPAMALGGVAFVAFNPMFIYMAGSINNDVIAALSGSAITLACVRLLKDEGGLTIRWGITLGLLYGLALLSKFNLAAIILLIELTISWVAWRKRQWRLWWSVNAVLVTLALLIAGWWFVRNQQLYGEPTGFERVTELWATRNPLESWGVAVFELPYTWTSLWGRFGYGQIPLPDGIYVGLQWVAALALVGVLYELVRTARSTQRPNVVPILLLAMNVVVFFVVLFTYMLVSPAGAMGRFFFPALPSLGMLIFFGLLQWAKMLGRVFGNRSEAGSFWFLSAVVVNLMMALLTLAALFAYLAPAYARPADFSEEVVPSHATDTQFDTLVKLHGFDLSTNRVHPGDSVELSLYWEVTGQPPGNYLFFVHLIDDAGTLVTQRDTHPGLGNFPSSEWQTGDRFIEKVRLFVPETAYAPSAATLSIGLYAPDAFRLAISNSEGEVLGDSLELAPVNIEPLTSPYPNALEQNFNNEIELIGYQYDRRQLSGGEDLTVTLYWRAVQTAPSDYIVQVHLINEFGASVISADSRPQLGQSPTDGWEEGEVVVDSHVLSLDPALPPSTYRIHVALIDADTKEAQNIVADDGHWIDDHLLLAGVRLR